MDRLAAEGVRFRNAFVTLSLCAPSRAAFLTGRYNHLNGITNNSRPFPADSITHASLLRAAGYQTAYIGKWHMGNQRTRPGFAYSASYIGQGQHQNCPFEINGTTTPTKGWTDDVATDFAIDFIRQHKDQPFSVVLGYKSPHSPRGGNHLPPRLRNLYDGQSSRPTPNCGVPAIFHKPAADGSKATGLSANEVHLDYLRHVAGVDDNIARLLDSLDSLGLADDTFVMYATDNGPHMNSWPDGAMTPFRNEKNSNWEGAFRVPSLVRWPGHIAPGTIFSGIVSHLDHLGRLGVDVLWLSPVYRSPQDDNGYDISDYQGIDPAFGTLADFDALLAAVHERGMKLVLDLVVNHSSAEHAWFKESRASRDNPKRDWYWWRPEPATGWTSFFSGPTWELDETTGEVGDPLV
jgi:arylsulfatase A-like enzyme